MLSFPKTGQKGKRFSTLNAPKLNKLRSKVLLYASNFLKCFLLKLSRVRRLTVTELFLLFFILPKAKFIFVFLFFFL